MLKKFQDQSGVALVTVLLAGAVLTAVTSTAAFMTIREFAATDDDQQSSRALSIAESGLDRMIIAMKSKEWGDMSVAGCGTTPAFTVTGAIDEGTADEGTFTATVVNTNCPATGVIPRPDAEQRLRIESTGDTADASRIVEQRVDINSATLPIGVFAETFAHVGGVGNGEFRNLSLITPGNVTGREKLETVGFDV